MFCSECGIKLVDGAKFCSNCGHLAAQDRNSAKKNDSSVANDKSRKENVNFEPAVSSSNGKTSKLELPSIIGLACWGLITLTVIPTLAVSSTGFINLLVSSSCTYMAYQIYISVKSRKLTSAKNIVLYLLAISALYAVLNAIFWGWNIVAILELITAVAYFYIYQLLPKVQN